MQTNEKKKNILKVSVMLFRLGDGVALCISSAIGCCADVPGVPAHHNEREDLDMRAGIKMCSLTT